MYICLWPGYKAGSVPPDVTYTCGLAGSVPPDLTYACGLAGSVPPDPTYACGLAGWLDQSHHMLRTYDAWSNDGVNEVEAGTHNGACVFPLRRQLLSFSTVTLHLDHREKEEVTSQGHTSLTTGIPHWITVPLYLVHPPVTCVYRAERRREVK